MNTTETQPASLDPDVMADLEAIMRHVNEGTPVDPELSRRVTTRAEKVTEEIRQKFGQTNIANDLIRSTREDE